ncbi:MAG: hypothetical protein KY431_00085 [Actinobacteria bacterium]|nr:hypothetical protein [Actinomycetota bacterium]
MGPTGPNANWGPIDDDPIGTASARLLAAGVSRRDRLDALSLLGLLGDHADHEGLVRLPLSTLAGEFSMPVARADRLLSTLVEVGAVASTDEGLVVVAWQPSGAEGLRLAAFLANVATVFDQDRSNDDEPETGADVVAITAPATVRAGNRASRAREPLVAALIAVAAALVATLAPSSGSLTGLRTVTSSPVPPVLSDRGATPAGPAETTPSAGAAAPSPAGSPWARPAPMLGDLPGEVAPPEASPAVRPTSAVPSPPGVSGPLPAAGVELAPGSDRLGSPPPPVPSGPLAPTPPGAMRAPTGRSTAAPATPSEAPASAPPVAPSVVCPAVEVPFALVESTLVRPGALDALTGLRVPAVMEVRGTLVNPSGADVVIGLLEVEVRLGEGPIAVFGSPLPRPVPAGGTEAWRVTVTVPPGASEDEPGVAEARVLRWSWLDDEVSKACPT